MLNTRFSRLICVLALSIFAAPLFVAVDASAQTTNLNIALQRGYRTGYSDGYMAGYRDTIDSLGRDATRHDEYAKADRAYNREYGTLDDYRDGYQQGFEAGYATGFEKRSFETNLPSEIKRRGVVSVRPAASNTMAQTTTAPAATTGSTVAAVSTSSSGYQIPVAYTNGVSAESIIIIPRDTELLVELQDDLSTERNREGDKFTAKVTSPSEIAGAIIEGRISKIVKPGRIKRRSELLLSFDRIIISEQRWSNFNAQLTEVMPVKGDNIKTVDTEGTAIGKSSIKSDSIKVGGATGTGLVIGAIAGGPVGAAVGAGVGAAFGVGAVVIERGKHVNLNRNQQVRIRTNYETQIR